MDGSPGFDSGRSQDFFTEIISLSENILDVVEIYRQHTLLRQETLQSLIVDQTHPVLVRAVKQKKKISTADLLVLTG